ncbi:Asp23/Gls24 family envelope stress response protein [uncultured Trichococcus sp.]|uniref:Asp23/Gls24 family envelope stress response protein n=1 Tax=uncultured Trichococcus sp. TaxID=189665 RepID=UPI002A18D2C4|nr:Asp23/Gls24 family envelope stress response protein [uncultured Trichococcus sp.]
MMEETNIPLANGPAPLGEIEIAPEVIEVIAGIAANEVDGVYAMQGSFKTGVNELLGRTAHNKGVHLTVDENGLVVDVYCYIKYGASVPKVALDMQEKVKEQVLYMSNLEVSQVNVHVVGLVAPKSEDNAYLDLDTELGENA